MQERCHGMWGREQKPREYSVELLEVSTPWRKAGLGQSWILLLGWKWS